MPKPIHLGELEQLALLALIGLGPDGYALALRRCLSERAGRRISRSAIYTTLDRLERKGYVAHELEGETPKRGGHPRRRYRVTETGIEALRRSRRLLTALWAEAGEALR
ncbi:MAG TPA: helix-turn-helix transcriptional regulator [Thermoanaerobaculia bacterium]|nr:helix-turn-helix transcriptional regulator [Thermoanaerobaculia bacterium]